MRGRSVEGGSRSQYARTSLTSQISLGILGGCGKRLKRPEIYLEMSTLSSTECADELTTHFKAPL